MWGEKKKRELSSVSKIIKISKKFWKRKEENRRKILKTRPSSSKSALLSRIDRVACFPDDRSRPEGVRSSAQRTIARDDDDDHVRVFVLRELDRWTLDPSKRHAIHIARDARSFSVSLKEMIRKIQNPNVTFARRFDEGKEERERERERDRVFKRQSGSAKTRTRRTHLDLGGLEAGDGRDLLSSSKHDCRCVSCVNNDEKVFVCFSSSLFFFFLTFDQPKKSFCFG